MTEFTDNPSTVNEQIASISQAKHMGEVLALANKYLPNWIVGFLDKYSNDYPALTALWDTVCTIDSEEKPRRKAQIMLVNFMRNTSASESEYKLLNSFVEVFTLAGFSVRRVHDIVPCTVCNAGIPSQELYNTMKNAKLGIPEERADKCSTC